MGSDEGGTVRRVLGLRMLSQFALPVLLCIGLTGPVVAQPAGPTTDVPLTHIAIPLPADKPFSSNIMDIDQGAHRLYFADRTLVGVDVIDISGPVGTYLQTVDTGSPPNGVSAAPSVHKVYAGLNDSSVAIIDADPASPSFNTVIARPNTGGEKRADEMDYDPIDAKLYVANSDDGFVTVIDGKSNEIVKRIDGLGSGLEQPRYNPADGMMYMAGTANNLLFKFDPKTDVLVKTYDVVDPCAPNGLAINPKTNQALLGCSVRGAYPHAAVWDIASEKVIAVPRQVGPGNTTIYDPVVDRFFFAARIGDNPAIGVFAGSPVQFVASVGAGALGGTSVAFDETNRVVYTQDIRPGMEGLVSFPLPEAQAPKP